MSFVTNNPGNIMASRAARSLLDDIQKRISARMAEMESRDYLGLLHMIRDELAREEDIDAWIAGEFASLSTQLADARLTDELGHLYEKLTTLAVRHFQARSSVSTLHEFCDRAMEVLLSTSMTIAVELLRQEGHRQPDCAWTLFASDGLGRREATGKSPLAIIFIHDEDDGEGAGGYFHLLALQLIAILSQCGILLQIGPLRNGHVFWHGPLGQWRQLMLESSSHQGVDAAGSPQSDRYARAIELMADLRPLCGDMALAGRVTEMTGAILAWEREREPFRQLARRVATMPVALGIFGRFRTARSGKHRGEFSLDEMAIGPLVASVRLMAIACGIRETSTTERIKALQAGSHLGVALADRLLVALHDFTRCQIDRQIAAGAGGEEHFFNPDLLGDEGKERFKAGLEDLTTLQRLVYQQIVEVD